jgi:hypothetical protein
MNPLQYFQDNEFMESQVLEFVYAAEEQTVTLICVYAHDAVMAILQGKKPPFTIEGRIYSGDMRKLVFSGVSKYERESGPFEELRDYVDKFISKDHRPDISIDFLRVTSSSKGNKFKARIGFVNFGKCRFSFTDLYVDRKLIRSINKGTGEDLKYIDIDTLEPIIDPNRPFKSS